MTTPNKNNPSDSDFNCESKLEKILNSSLNVYAAEFVPRAFRREYNRDVNVSKINEYLTEVDGEFNNNPVSENDRMGDPPIMAFDPRPNDLYEKSIYNINVADIPLPPDPIKLRSNNPARPLKNPDHPIGGQFSNACQSNNMPLLLDNINTEFKQIHLPTHHERNMNDHIHNEKVYTNNNEEFTQKVDKQTVPKSTQVSENYQKEKPLAIPNMKQNNLGCAGNGQGVPEEHKKSANNPLMKPCQDSPKTNVVDLSSPKSEQINEQYIVKEKKKKKKKDLPEDICSQKEHVNIVFIGHVDAGKSTIGGHLLRLMGVVDNNTIDKHEKGPIDTSQEPRILSWALDTNVEERKKGKTIETGRGHFETPSKHITILDTPGHRCFVPSMISGTSQADIAVLVISARKNEFETGFENGQTREHVMLAKAAGIANLVVLVNKMDDPTVKWVKNRFDTCCDEIIKFLKKVGFKSNDIMYIPVSGLTGHGLKDKPPKHICKWYNGPSFIEYIDSLKQIDRKLTSPLIIPIVDKYRNMGNIALGRIVTGTARKNQSVIVMPNKMKANIEKLWSNEMPVDVAKAGENVKLMLKATEEIEIAPGFVVCDILKPITTAKRFDAQLVILDCKSIITKGYKAMMHMNCITEEVQVKLLICKVNMKTGEKSFVNKLRFVKQDDMAIMRIECTGVICVTVYKDFPLMGRFTLREENKIIAIGKVLKLVG